MLSTIESVNNVVNNFIWGVPAMVCIVGATMDLGLMWNIAETFNGLIAIPNLIAVFLLSGVVVKHVKEYFAGEGKGV
nr:alanine:cation symporter family protein [Coprococcus comes]